MRRAGALIIALMLSVPAAAAPGTIAFVNGTGSAISDVQIRPLGKGWSPLAPGLSPGARTSKNLTEDDCAYDVQANVAGTTVTWSRLNLCEVKTVTLNRRADGTSWADYD